MGAHEVTLPRLTIGEGSCNALALTSPQLQIESPKRALSTNSRLDACALPICHYEKAQVLNGVRVLIWGCFRSIKACKLIIYNECTLDPLMCACSKAVIQRIDFFRIRQRLCLSLWRHCQARRNTAAIAVTTITAILQPDNPLKVSKAMEPHL